MPIDTRIEGDPESIRTAANWLSSSYHTAVGDSVTAVYRARGDGEWAPPGRPRRYRQRAQRRRQRNQRRSLRRRRWHLTGLGLHLLIRRQDTGHDRPCDVVR